MATFEHIPASIFEPGQTIVVGQGGGFPGALVRRLPPIADRLVGSTLVFGMADPALFAVPHVRLRTFFPAGALGNQDAFTASRADYWRVPLFALATTLAVPGAVDVALVRVAKPRDGFYSIAFNADYILAVARTAERLVIEECPDAPWLGAHIAIGDPRIAAIIKGPPGISDRPGADNAAGGGDLAAQLSKVLPGILVSAAALQVGMGTWTRCLGDLIGGYGLVVHTGLADSWLASALAKDWQCVSHVTAGAIGATSPLVAMAEKLMAEGRLSIEPATETHDPAKLAAIDGLVAVNSVWQIDRAGRGNCEWLETPDGTILRGGLGGLPDFASAAAAHPNGRSILCVRSTDQWGRSRFVPELTGEAVSLDVEQVDMVVSEMGVTELRGCDTAERARRIERNVVAAAFREN